MAQVQIEIDLDLDEVEEIEDAAQKQCSLIEDQDDMDNLNQFIKLMKLPHPKKQRDESVSIVSLSPDDHQAKEFFQKCQEAEDDSAIFELPPNFRTLVDKQIVQMQTEVMRVVRDVNEKLQAQMIKFGGKCCAEIKTQFEEISRVESGDQRRLKKRIAQACSSSGKMCTSIGKLLEKVHELDSEFLRIKHEFHHQGRKSDLSAAGVLHLRRDKLFQYRRNQTSFQCPMCITQSITISSLVTHIRKTHHAAIPEGFVCLVCNKPFRIVSQLAPHMWSIHRTKVVNESFECQGCGESFATKFKTLDHIPKCLAYCAGVNFVLKMQRKQEAKIQEYEQRGVLNIDDDAIEVI